jgi:hypothetical protein
MLLKVLITAAEPCDYTYLVSNAVTQLQYCLFALVWLGRGQYLGLHASSHGSARSDSLIPG